MAVVYYLFTHLIDRLVGLSPVRIVQPVFWILAGLSWSLGLFWILWAYSYLIFVGSGSPFEAFGVALEPTKRLVTAGPYAYVRNPMVFGLLFIFLGEAFFGNSIMGFVLLPITAGLIALYIKLFEEKALVRRFGVAFDHYRDHVPMIIPRIAPYVPPGN